MIRVVIESPYAGKTPEEIQENVRYLRACMSDCIHRGEAPYASHALYTQPGVLRDEIPAERNLGMEAGFIWGEVCDRVVVYTDRGVTPGMVRGIGRHQDNGKPIEYRKLGGEWS